jgi:hypothetical protein
MGVCLVDSRQYKNVQKGFRLGDGLKCRHEPYVLIPRVEYNASGHLRR